MGKATASFMEASSSNEMENLKNEETFVNEENGNPQLADALAKVIRMSKRKRGKSIVLSKAKLYCPETQKEKRSPDFEIVPDPNVKIKDEDIKPQIENIKPKETEIVKFRLSKQQKLQRGRLKPSALDREKERPLAKIATRGVVQLFNAVRQHQSTLNKEINKPGVTESKKEKIHKSVDRKAFLDVLSGKKKNANETSCNFEESPNFEDVKSEPEDEQPSWEVLRDDFMMGAKLKDWDKKELSSME